MNKLEVFNEMSILITGYHLFIFTDFCPVTDIQNAAGYNLIAIVVCNLLVNMVIMGIKTY